nr:MAG TPA: hypothetical protein [Caudoviricetes sp.]DAW50132.1 MAG TPA: hypothetical protein [Caudoviricetes sp.]
MQTTITPTTIAVIIRRLSFLTVRLFVSSVTMRFRSTILF